MVTQYPVKKNAAFTAVFPILDADGDLVTGAAGLDSEISKDGGTFADCTNEATEIATSSGVYKLDLTATEMNADIVAIIVKTSTQGAKTTVLVFYTTGQTLNEMATYIVATYADTNELQIDWVNGGRLDLLVDGVKAKTDNLPATPADEATLTGIKGAGFDTGTDSLVKIHDDHVTYITATPPTKDQVADQVWDELISGHVGAGSFGAKNQKVVPSESAADYKADVSNLDVAVSTRSDFNEATDSVTLTAAGIDAILDEVVEGSLTMRHVLKLFLSALAGKSAGGGGVTITFRDNADSKNRITATVDANGNRTAVTLDAA